ncbi:hypothetical protein ACFV0T_11750 [Streptomyces sp. NPDC059582]|uniref:hypothetical protein n=1 Tax=Streptomyces sp. NPDC059582 TaxID=3346875 RepID=UPI0036D1FD29
MGPVVRRPVAWVVAVVLFVEALGIAAVNWFMGVVVDRQDMSLAGLDPDVMSLSSKIGGIGFGLYFALCGLVALLVALRNRPPAGLGRVLLISAAVVHCLLGALAWGLLGRNAFAFMMVVLALIVLLLMTYDRQEGAAAGKRGKPDEPQGPQGSQGDQEPQGFQESQESQRFQKSQESQGPQDVPPVTPPPAPSAT